MFKAAELIHSKTSLKIRFPDSWNFIPALPTFDRKQMSLVAVSSGSESEEQRKEAWEKTLQLVDVTDKDHVGTWGTRLILLPSPKVEWENEMYIINTV